MIITLAWKELREHQSVWLTMVIVTVALGLGLAQIIALQDPSLAVPVAALTLLGLAATYGAVCGAMMFAGEHEGGTLVFLDIFSGRRGLLWAGKFLIGILLAITQALTVAGVLWILKHEPPTWAMAMVGAEGRRPDPYVWFFLLPVVTLEAYAWGLLGSSLAQRVLAGAAVAAVGVTPVWLLGIVVPPASFLTVLVFVALGALAISYALFLNQSKEAFRDARPEPEERSNAKDRFLDLWDEFDREDELGGEMLAPDIPTVIPVQTAPAADRKNANPPQAAQPQPAAPPSPTQVLWWLTFQQAWPVLWIFALAALGVGLLLPANPQVLWPIATLLLGIACGVAAFAPEQRDLTYQFLAAQHLPLRMFWRFKIVFWLSVAVAAVLLMVAGCFVSLAVRSLQFGPRPLVPAQFQGSLRSVLGPSIFFAVWLVYGFCAGQLVVWYCRKNILALLVSMMVAAGALAVWMPPLLCGGMRGWQVWGSPVLGLATTWFLMRAWAGGRLQERKPLMALVGFGATALLWALIVFGYRAIEAPDVGEPLDAEAFRAALPVAQDDTAKIIHQAINEFDERNVDWHLTLVKAVGRPPGILEAPRADGYAPILKHLVSCRKICDDIFVQDFGARPLPPPDQDFAAVASLLALSRSLRHKAPMESYRTGVEVEEKALRAADQRLLRAKQVDRKALRRFLDELNRHAQQTPAPIECAQAECFRAKGALINPAIWSFSAPDSGTRLPERWLAGGISLSLDSPWEAERSARLWQLVWVGLFRAIETPHWDLPEPADDFAPQKNVTHRLLEPWVPDPKGGMTRARLAQLIDSSWLADERLFCDLATLRQAANRGRWRVDSMRLATALTLYRLEEGRPAAALEVLQPKYFPDGLPRDPYSGQPFGYRGLNEHSLLWSTGPDRIDHGGRVHGAHLPDNDRRWAEGGFDLIMVVP